MSAAHILLSPEDEALVDEKVSRGEFQSREAVVSHALKLLRTETAPPATRMSLAERARRLEAFFEEVDRDPPPRRRRFPMRLSTARTCTITGRSGLPRCSSATRSTSKSDLRINPFSQNGVA